MSIPASDPNDSDDVVLALETAEALWNKGDPGEALRWLRRAAEAAGDSGNDMRAVVLAKAVAELNAAGSDAAPKQVRPPPLPPQAPAAKSDAQDVDESPLSAKGGLKGVSKAPPRPPSARKSQAPPKPSAPPSSARPSRSEPEAPASQEAAAREAEPPPKKKMNPPPTPSSVSAASSETDGERPAAAESSATESSPAEYRPPTKSLKNRSGSSSHGRSSLTPGSKAGPASTPAAAKSGKKRNFARAALRVYVTTKDQDGERLEVFVLNEGQRPPPGAVEALLVPLRRGAKLLR